MLDVALPKLSEAAGATVEGVVGDPDPVAAVQDAINLRGFDEIIISTLPDAGVALAEARPPEQDLGHGAAGDDGHAGRRAGGSGCTRPSA